MIVNYINASYNKLNLEGILKSDLRQRLFLISKGKTDHHRELQSPWRYE